MGKSIKKNYLLNLFYQILTLITPLITAPYLSRVLGPDGVGTYSYIEASCSYFVLFATLGLTTFGQREISYVQQDRKKRSIVFWETNIIELVSSVVCIIAYVCFSLAHTNYKLYLVLVFNLLAVIANISWLYQGLEEFGKIVFRNVLFKVLNIIFIFIFVKKTEDLIIFLLGTSVFLMVNNLTYWIGIFEYIDKPVLSELHPMKHLKTVFSLFIPTIAISIYTVLDKTMIGMITSSAFENGYYEQALKISKVVLTIVISLGTVMIPRIGYHFGNGDKDQIKKYMYKAYRFVWFLGIPLCFGLITVSYNFVPWFFGPGYEKVAPLIGILAFLILSIGINNVTGIQYLIPTQRQNTFTFTVLIGAAVNFLLNVILIYKFKAFGAAVASVTAETVIAVVQLYIVRKELSCWDIVKSGKTYLAAGIIMGSVLWVIEHRLSASIINTAVLIVVGMMVYSLLLLIFKDDFFLTNIKSITNYICKKIKSGLS